MNDVIGDAVQRAIRAMNGTSPTPLLEDVEHHLRRTGESLTEAELVEVVTSTDVNDPARRAFLIQLSRWDTSEEEVWTKATVPQTAARRALVLDLLGFGPESRDRINEAYPLNIEGSVVIADKPADWEPWYTDQIAADRSFYWDAYRGVLDRKLGPEAVDELDRTTREVVRRLADPTRTAPYQSKGLVVGHVQSGKTANFTGVIAKAIDAGYRLVIVLSGTIELLRSQTQRRLDMELVGQENIATPGQLADPQLQGDIDYLSSNDRDWRESRFVRHGFYPPDRGEPGIRRLTAAKGDYRRLQRGLGVLDFRHTDRFTDPARRLYDPVNLYGTDARLAVVKKNAAVLAKLVTDLRSLRTNLDEIPTLIIDDEADQASINTVDPRKNTAERVERTAINRHIAELLRELPRAQYIGYTATPFANVFVDPQDAEDIFPKDFIVSLAPPPAYLGGRYFHDLDRDVNAGDGPGTYADSAEKAFVRDLLARPDDDHGRLLELRDALDAFVLSGAIKLYRAAQEGTRDAFRHHTMLVHESVNRKEHELIAARVREAWKSAAYSSPAGYRRLYELWQSDFAPVSAARAPHAPKLTDFGDLRPFIGRAVDMIETGHDILIIVNGAAEKDYLQDDLDFQSQENVWKILVGGTKLSRGFTVEGLTISYYTRRTIAADTLMQMGRWFGYRPEYADLVRLYIGRNVPGSRKGTTVDLYEAFGAVVRDEEDFREELRAFRGSDDLGVPRVRPIDIPPLVFQSLPWLKPTSRNKMFNAVLTVKGEGGKVEDFSRQAPRSAATNARHFAAVRPLLDVASHTGRFFDLRARRTNPAAAISNYDARYGVVPAETLIEILRKFSWHPGFDINPTIGFMQDAVSASTLTDWAVIVPMLAGNGPVRERVVDGVDLHIVRRVRRTERDGAFSGSATGQRDAMYVISGGIDAPNADMDGLAASWLARPEYAHIRDLKQPGRGALLLTFAADQDERGEPDSLPNPAAPGDIASLFSLAFPWRAAPGGRIGFSVRKPGAGPVIDVDEV